MQITLGEVATMYSSNELNILPEFQRLHRWSLEKKSNFVESILIGIPVPSVFVYETDLGTWELVDGLQRISTILEFMGLLRDVDNPGTLKRSIMASTKYLPSLKDVVWEARGPGEITLQKPLQLFFRRARLDFEILKHPSDPRTKYDLFQRLNRGGAYATEQEVRTCSMVLADPQFTQNLKDIAAQEGFRELFRITDEQHQKQKDLEYLIRILVHVYVEYSLSMDVEEFLSTGILQIVERRIQDEAIETAKWVLETLLRVRGQDALVPTDPPRPGGGGGRFTLRALEVIAVGIAKNRSSLDGWAESDEFINERISAFWVDPVATELSAGMRGTTRIQRSVPFGEKWFDPRAKKN
ncbi:DUF262 domain-containing protein [Nocardia sp. NPDC055002]